MLNNTATQLKIPNDINLTKIGYMFDRTLGHCLPSEFHRVLRGKKIIFGVDEKNLVPIEGWGKRSNPYCTETITTIQTIKENTIVAALDSSSIQIAETEDGILYAVKSGITISAPGTTCPLSIPQPIFTFSPLKVYPSFIAAEN